MSYRVGIDLGGTNIVAGVVDDEYHIIAKANCKTNVPPSRSGDLRFDGGCRERSCQKSKAQDG